MVALIGTLLNNFENSVRNHKMKGSMPTDECKEIEDNYRNSKESLIKAIRDLEEEIESLIKTNDRLYERIRLRRERT